jgi:hypothetical protein
MTAIAAAASEALVTMGMSNFELVGWSFGKIYGASALAAEII